MYFRKTNIFAEFNFFILSVLLWTDTPLREHSSWNNPAAALLREVSRPRRQDRSSSMPEGYFLLKVAFDYDILSQRRQQIQVNCCVKQQLITGLNTIKISLQTHEESYVISDDIPRRSAFKRYTRFSNCWPTIVPAYSLIMT